MSFIREEKTPFEEELRKTAKALVAPGKGILAADESTNTIRKRLESISVPNSKENRENYRRALFTAENLSQNISGVILFDETLRTPSLIQPLKDEKIILGIKVDKGTEAMALSGGVLFTKGLDGLSERCKEYYALGCRFAKWRAVLKIENGFIAPQSVEETAYTLARYPATCQANGLVPIVEPEILMDGGHCVGTCARWTTRVVSAVVRALKKQHVIFEGMLLKTNMCVPGNSYTGKKNLHLNAQKTVEALQRSLPAAVPGVTFLSGGQSEEEATRHLNEMNKLGPHPWTLSFSFGRALQSTALKAWKGKQENIPSLQKALVERARANGEAALGKYEGGAAGGTESLHVEGYVY